MKRYVVTGAAGHVGSTVIRQLAESDALVAGLILPGETPQVTAANLRYIEGDVRDAASLDHLFAAVEDDAADPSDTPHDIVVIHTAGIISIQAQLSPALHDVNVNGTAAVIAACRRHHARRLVYTSSVHALPEKPAPQVITEATQFDPAWVHGGYAKTKAEATQLVLDAAADSLDTVVVHPSGIIGPYDLGHNHMVQLIRNYVDKPVSACVAGGYDFVDVRDVAAGCLAAAERGKTGSCYLLTGSYCTIRHLLEMCGAVCGMRPIFNVPLPLARAIAPAVEWVCARCGVRPLFTAYSLYTLATNANFSHDKASRELDWHPRSIEDSVTQTIAWLKAPDTPQQP